jgi:hypothetical protein
LQQRFPDRGVLVPAVYTAVLHMCSLGGFLHQRVFCQYQAADTYLPLGGSPVV